MKKKLFLRAAATSLAIIMMAGCGTPAASQSTAPSSTAPSSTAPSSTEASKPKNENVFNLGVTSNSIATKLDSVWVNRGDPYKTLLFRSLFVATPDLTGVKPDLAESYTMSTDGMKIEVVMKTNILWHDNTPITAEDVKWSIEAAMKGSLLNAIYTNAFICLDGATEYKAGTATEIKGIAINGNTITFTLAQPSSTFLNILAQFAILPKHLLKDANLLELHNDKFWENPVGSGMFKLQEFNPGNYVVYLPFEGYEGTKPSVEKMVVSAVGDVVAAAQNGQVDYIATSNPEQITQLDKMTHMTKFPVDINYYRYLVCNLADETGKVNQKIADPRIREALIMAIDRQSILDSLFTGLGAVTDTGIPSGAPEYKALKSYKYDVEGAKALLKEAGFDFSKSIKLRYYAGDQASVSMMEAIAFSWEAVGVKVDVAKFQGPSSEELFTIKDYDFSLKALSAFAYEEYYGEYASTNSNFGKILGKTTDFDQLTTKLGATSDAAARKEILAELQKLEQEKLYKMPIGSFGVYIYINTDKLDIGSTTFGNPYYNYDNSFASWTVK